jgi:sugar/nucleoside kinase (ribokinase family)
VSQPIVVAGNLTLDDTVTPDGAFAAAPGGDALYASLGVCAWGRTPVLLTLIGDDYPAAHLERIAAAGVDVSHVRRTAGPTVHYRVTYGPDGTRLFEWISTEDRLLLTSPTPADYGRLVGAAWLHVAAMPIDAQEVAVAAGRAAMVPMSLDPHEEYIVGFEGRLASLVEGVSFMPSELEARLLFPDLVAADGLDLGFAAAERLDEWRPALVAIKLGAVGSVVRWRGRSVHVPAPEVPVIDPTGAGDAYCGGFVAGWLPTGSPEVAAACGTIAAADTIGAFGAFSDRGGAGPRFARMAELLIGAGHDRSAARSDTRSDPEPAAGFGSDGLTNGLDVALASMRDQLGLGSPA